MVQKDIPLSKSTAELRRIAAAIEELDSRTRYRTMDNFHPYVKQQEFFDLGVSKRERMLMAGNQLGKTEAGAYEVACHLTGEYPDDWLGRRWERPVKWWAAGETSLLTRDVIQKKLCGEPGVEVAFGAGMIPRDNFVGKPSLARGITDAYDTVQVKHKSGGVSILRFKSYEQGRAKFQGETLDGVWLDEEPPMDIYSESLTRLTATKGMLFVTFTPLKGRSDVVIRFLDEPSPNRAYIVMTIDDALHIPADERQTIIDGYPAHEREARARGVPMLGSGRIFTTPEAIIAEPRIAQVPIEWAKLWGIDFGIGHPFGAALIAWDREADIIHVLHVLKMADALPLQHAAAMKPIGGAVPVAWPQDGTQREKTSGEALALSYKAQGLKMLHDHATFEEGGISTEAGILQMQERFSTARLKVAAHLSEFFEEYRFYHRKDGQIVKVKDDIMSAVRVAVMAKRFAKPVALGRASLERAAAKFAKGVEGDHFGC